MSLVKRADVIATARKWIGVRFAHQGRSRSGIDCGGLILMVGRATGLSELEELGYSHFPRDGRFEQLLEENTDPMPHLDELLRSLRNPRIKLKGDELKPTDLLAYASYNRQLKIYEVRHIAMVTMWDNTNRSYMIIDAANERGVSEFPLLHPYTKHLYRAYRIRGLVD